MRWEADMMDERMELTFLDSGREPQCAPDPQFPDGKVLDFGMGQNVQRCVLEVPYPAPRCGAYQIHCSECGVTVALTVAGRRDDPRTVALPCKPKKSEIN